MRLVSTLKKKDLAAKKVLLRADLDVALKNGKVLEPFRLDRALLTIKFLLKNGAKVTVIGHIGEKGESLGPVIKWLKAKVKSKNLTILENLRRDKGEETNNLGFAKKLASGFDLYVNDAFAVSHRPHASIITLPKLLPAYAGLEFEREVKTLASLKKPAKPLLLIIGGAKFESKLLVINNFLVSAHKIFIGGALANLFFKRLGYETGQSYLDPHSPSITALLKSLKITLPIDVIVKRIDGKKVIVKPEEVRSGDVIVDAGPESLKLLTKEITQAKTIIWNGPLGKFEAGYSEGTKSLAAAISKSKAKVIIGGGDTVAALDSLKKLMPLMKLPHLFISTGGGAMLEYLATGTLPGIEALE